MAAMANEITTAGPAFSAAAMPVSENSPAPMIAPMPSPTRLQGPRVRSRPWPPPSASRRRRSIGFVRISPSAMLSCAIARPPVLIKD